MRASISRGSARRMIFVHLRYIWLKKIGRRRPADVPAHSTLPECGTGGHHAAELASAERTGERARESGVAAWRVPGVALWATPGLCTPARCTMVLGGVDGRRPPIHLTVDLRTCLRM